ncbi:MAG: hypothetical protein IPP44_12135 [Ideonella sp.]|nr:hypothetical protein [Ideonella sp.]
MNAWFRDQRHARNSLWSTPAGSQLAASPELNPAEHLWEAVREDCFANHVFADLDAVEVALTKGCDDSDRTQSMTGFAWVTSISLNAS